MTIPAARQPESVQFPALAARTIFFDLDGTVVTEPPADAPTIISTLIHVIADAHQVRIDAASAKVFDTFNPEVEPIDPHLGALGITRRRFWDAVMRWMPSSVRPHDDAVEVIPVLHRRGFRLFTATTNSNLICCAKLAAAGLGDFDGSPYFDCLIGGAEVHPNGKTTPAFYRNLLQRAQTSGEDVVHVGDNPHTDGELAHRAGINQIVLVQRGQRETRATDGCGILSVHSLRVLPDIVSCLTSRRPSP